MPTSSRRNTTPNLKEIVKSPNARSHRFGRPVSLMASILSGKPIRISYNSMEGTPMVQRVLDRKGRSIPQYISGTATYLPENLDALCIADGVHFAAHEMLGVTTENMRHYGSQFSDGSFLTDVNVSMFMCARVNLHTYMNGTAYQKRLLRYRGAYAASILMKRLADEVASSVRGSHPFTSNRQDQERVLDAYGFLLTHPYLAPDALHHFLLNAEMRELHGIKHRPRLHQHSSKVARVLVATVMKVITTTNRDLVLAPLQGLKRVMMSSIRDEIPNCSPDLKDDIYDYVYRMVCTAIMQTNSYCMHAKNSAPDGGDGSLIDDLLSNLKNADPNTDPDDSSDDDESQEDDGDGDGDEDQEGDGQDGESGDGEGESDDDSEDGNGNGSGGGGESSDPTDDLKSQYESELGSLGASLDEDGTAQELSSLGAGGAFVSPETQTSTGTPYSEYRELSRKLSDEFRPVMEDADPYYESQQSSGRIHLPTVMQGVEDYDTAYQSWNPGRMSDTSFEICLLLDSSGSTGNFLDKISQAAWAIARGAEELSENINVTIFQFGSTSSIVKPSDVRASERYWKLSITGSTNPLDALVDAKTIFEKSEKAHKLLFTLTDGAWDNDQVSGQSSRYRASNVASQDTSGVMIDDHNASDKVVSEIRQIGVHTALAYYRVNPRSIADAHNHEHLLEIESADLYVQLVQSTIRKILKG